MACLNLGTLRVKPPDGAALGVGLRQEGSDNVAFGARRGPHDQGQVEEGIIFVLSKTNNTQHMKK